MKKIGVLFLLVLALFPLASSMGLSPAKIDVNFIPNLDTTFKYKVFAGDQDVELYVEGDLSDYVILSKNLTTGIDNFDVRLKLPLTIEEPGLHRLLIGAREVKKASGGLGVAIDVRAVIYVHVPYPGQYVELDLKKQDGNIGEEIEFILSITNLGQENIITSSKIEIYSQEQIVEGFALGVNEIISQETKKLTYVLNTSSYSPGLYRVLGIVDYGKMAFAESEFKLGDLLVNVISVTSRVKKGAISKFFVEAESIWNNKIKDIYANVSVGKEGGIIQSFKTPSETLEPWEKRKLEGYIDTTDIETGEYDVKTILHYEGKTTEYNSKLKIGGIELWVYILIGVVVLALAIVLILIRKKLLRFVRKRR